MITHQEGVAQNDSGRHISDSGFGPVYERNNVNYDVLYWCGKGESVAIVTLHMGFNGIGIWGGVTMPLSHRYL